jgi:hypothetical protein
MEFMTVLKSSFRAHGTISAAARSGALGAHSVLTKWPPSTTNTEPVM